jgi:hypothetical protein
MTSTVLTRRTLAAPDTARRPLLVGGALAGPLFLGVVVVQALAHDDFQARNHPLSSLALGDHGWVQIANFVVAGLLVAGLALELRRELRGGPAGRWGPIFVGVNGLSLVVAGAFLADPVNGYPRGISDDVTAHGMVHVAAATVSGLALYGAYLVFARRFAALGRRGWAVAGVAAIPVDLALTGVAVAVDDLRPLYVGLAVGFGWLSLLALHVLRAHDA